jgi:predicted membrane channel-forming protein YqfA (hemolysin III family)
MIRCRECGTENSAEARYCSKCGALIRPMREQYFRHRSVNNIWLLLIGSIMIIYGLIRLLETYYHITLELWPILAILFGLALMYGSLRRR